MPAGRPTLYKPEYCERVIELGKEGKSPAQIASALGVIRETMLAWGDQHEEFFTALKRAKVEEQNWWEEKAQGNLANREFNAPVWKTSMQARFREDYTERREVTGADGGPIKTEDAAPRDLAKAMIAVLREATDGSGD